MGANDSSLLKACGCGDREPKVPRCDARLPDDPGCGVNYHFGMLLGEADFRAEQGFHLGHHRRHQRLLHGFGVVYGFLVTKDANDDQSLLRVSPGYAVDRRGRDLLLEKEQCLALPAWLEKHLEDQALQEILASANPDDRTFDADVMLCQRPCLDRPVPAIPDPCANPADGPADIAYSRVCETVQLSLRPRRQGDVRPAEAPAQPSPYRLLRVLADIEAPGAGDNDTWLAAERDRIARLPGDEREAALERLWQQVVARAAAETQPVNSHDPAGPYDDCLEIARLTGVRVWKGHDAWHATIHDIDIDDRPTLLPVSVLQAMLPHLPLQP